MSLQTVLPNSNSQIVLPTSVLPNQPLPNQSWSPRSDNGGNGYLYVPNCSQYSTSSPGFIRSLPNGRLEGNCSPSVDNNPYQPGRFGYDFSCSPNPRGGYNCLGTCPNGSRYFATSPDESCCQAQCPGFNNNNNYTPSYPLPPYPNPNPYPSQNANWACPGLGGCIYDESGNVGGSRFYSQGHCERSCGPRPNPQPPNPRPPRVGCNSDSDCGNGQSCNSRHICVSQPNPQPQPPHTLGCSSDRDCGPQQTCNSRNVCVANSGPGFSMY